MNEKVIVAVILLASCGIFGAAWYANQNKSSNIIIETEPKQLDMSKLKVIDTKVGTGAEAQPGKTVFVHYTGKLENGTVFDSSISRGKPLDFPLGAGIVIEGWELGISGMKVGGKRTLTIPPELGYGSRDMGAIPPNSTLIFDVELVDVK
jgi:FKBP-type peptidyl-prolyl cis-trans isomerase